MNKTRLFLVLFWIFVVILLISILQNYLLALPLLSNDVFIVMGIIVSLVFLDEITKSLNNKKRIRAELEEELRREYESKK